MVYLNLFPELDELFNKFDTDKDGKITFENVREFCLTESVQVFGNNPTDDDIKKYCDKMDLNGQTANETCASSMFLFNINMYEKN